MVDAAKAFGSVEINMTGATAFMYAPVLCFWLRPSFESNCSRLGLTLKIIASAFEEKPPSLKNHLRLRISDTSCLTRVLYLASYTRSITSRRIGWAQAEPKTQGAMTNASKAEGKVSAQTPCGVKLQTARPHDRDAPSKIKYFPTVFTR